MEAMRNFTLWFLQMLPEFLMSEPIIYFVAIGVIALVIKAISQLFFKGGI